MGHGHPGPAADMSKHTTIGVAILLAVLLGACLGVAMTLLVLGSLR